MRNKFLLLGIYSFILVVIAINLNKQVLIMDEKQSTETFIKFDDTSKIVWSKDFQKIEIYSSIDNKVQNAYFFKAKADEKRPLIVSLHTWSGYFDQVDDLAELCIEKDVNYIHPDFRGANWTKDACCSKLGLTDIDDAIDFAINNSFVDVSKIYVIGVSGGGYAALSTFMKSKHNISKFSAWASISDLTAWYEQSRIRKNNYADHILACTGSTDTLNIEEAKARSPIFWTTPVEKLKKSKLYIYAGIYDGIQGSVPITHSINFYNKVLKDLSVQDKTKFVSDYEKLKLLEFRKPLDDLGSISGRKICLKKEAGNIKLLIFEGNHEMLIYYALTEILK